MSLYKPVNVSLAYPDKLAHNVPALTDVFTGISRKSFMFIIILKQKKNCI